MSQSVQVGLVFPRSGQQLSVNISRQQADLLDTHSGEHVSRSEQEYLPKRSYPIHSKEKPFRPQ